MKKFINKMISTLLLLPIASGILTSEFQLPDTNSRNTIRATPNRRVAPSRHVVHWDRLQDPELRSTKILTVKMYDTIDFICPTRNPATSRYISRLERRHNSLRTPVRNFTVHQMHGETGFALCDTNQSQIILECKATSPKETKFSVRVQRKSAQPNGLVFEPNMTYYYLSKNLGNNNVERLNDSQCQTGRASHMRLKVIVEAPRKIGKTQTHAIGTVSRLTDSNSSAMFSSNSIQTILLFIAWILLT